MASAAGGVKGYLRQTFLSGIVVVLPAAMILTLLAGAIASLRAAVEPFAALLHLEPRFPGAWAALVLVLLTFLAGLILQWSPVRAFTAGLRRRLAAQVPFLGFLSSLEDSLINKSGNGPIKAVLVETGQGLVPAFVVEELADGRHVVFIPDVPNPSHGVLCIVTAERLQPLDATVGQLAHCLSHWGVGLRELVDPAREAPQRGPMELPA